MNERTRTLALAFMGAAVGSVAAYLFFTPQGRATRRQIEAALEDLGNELGGLRSTIAKAKGTANEGWRLLDDFGDVVLGEERMIDAGRYARNR